MIYASSFWGPKAKGYAVSSSPACAFCPCEMFAGHAKLKLLGLHFHSPVQSKLLTQEPWEGPATNRWWPPPLPLQASGSCGCSTPGLGSVPHSTCGAYSVKRSSFNSCQGLQRYQIKHLPRAKFWKWRCPRLQIKKWGMFKSALRIACSISTMCLCYALIIL